MVYIKYPHELRKKARAKRAMVSTDSELHVDLLQTRASDADVAALIERFEGRLRHIHVACPMRVCNPRFLSNALAKCTNLTVFRCTNVYYGHGSSEDAEEWGEAFRQMRSLEVVRIMFYQNLIPLLSDPNNKLRSIKIGKGPVRDKRIFARFLEACGSASRLKELAYKLADYGSTDVNHVTNLLRDCSSLESLKVEIFREMFDSDSEDEMFDSDSEDDDDNNELVELANIVRAHKSLTSLDLTGFWRNGRSRRPFADEIKAFCNAMLNNTKLVELMIRPWMARWGGKGWRASEKHARSNLERIDFYLALNEAGRDKVLGPSAKPDTNDWIDVISNQEDISLIYFFLQHNPALCNVAATKDDSNRAVRGTKRKRQTLSD